MVKVYILKATELGDRNFHDIPVMELKKEAKEFTLEEFQTAYNMGITDSSTEFIKFVAI